MSEIIWFLFFSDWLISLSMMFSRFIYAVAKGKIFYLFVAEEYSIGICPIVVLSTYVLMDTWLLHSLAIVNDAAVNIGVHIFF